MVFVYPSVTKISSTVGMQVWGIRVGMRGQFIPSSLPQEYVGSGKEILWYKAVKMICSRMLKLVLLPKKPHKPQWFKAAAMYYFRSNKQFIDFRPLLCLQSAGRLVVHWLIIHSFSRDNSEVSGLLQMDFSPISKLAWAYSHGRAKKIKPFDDQVWNQHP